MRIFVVFLSCVIGAAIGFGASKYYSEISLAPVLQSVTGENDETAFTSRNFSGTYLSSQFAQRHHDWLRAENYMEDVMTLQPQDTMLMSKAMVLAMGSGQTQKAMDLARKIEKSEANNPLPLMFLAIDSFHQKNYKQASAYIKQMPLGSLSDFILPLLDSWAKASEGVYSIEDLNKNSIHLYHAILISDFLKQKGHIEGLLQKALGVDEISLQDLERLADIYAYIGKKETATELYDKIVAEWPENRTLARKIEKYKKGEAVNFFHPVSSPENGVAEALYEMARLLYQEYSDDSARVFAYLALYLNPDLTDAKLLLGAVAARNQRYDDAIAYYQGIPPENEKYAESRRMAADILEDSGRIDEALDELRTLVKKDKDVEALVQMGDIYRRQEKFQKAVDAYNQAAAVLGEPIPREYWQVYYVRGMSYERLGKWDKAEADLKAALAYQPDQPLVLNYLGYAWADQGVNLDQSLTFIRKAAALEPEDGFITDSLGWVLYRMGKYEEAVPHLEKAVALLPYDAVINDHLGDAYWRIGRKLEARFQWKRAKSHADDQKLIADIDRKLENGLEKAEPLKEIHSQADGKEILKP